MLRRHSCRPGRHGRGRSFRFACPRCGGDIRLIAFITEPGPIRKILTHLGEPTPDGRHAQSRCSRAVRQPEDRCGSAIDRALLHSRARAKRRAGTDGRRSRAGHPRPSGRPGCEHARGGRIATRRRRPNSLPAPCPTAAPRDTAPRVSRAGACDGSQPAAGLRPRQAGKRGRLVRPRHQLRRWRRVGSPNLEPP